MNNLLKCGMVLLLMSIFSACKRDLVDLPVSPSGKGSGNISTSANLGNTAVSFSRFISIGDSQTAGFADNGLYLSGQQASFPAVMAKQMLSASGGTFAQPLFTQDQANGSGYLKLSGYNSDGTPNVTSVTSNLAVRGTTSVVGFGTITLYTKYQGDLNNFGVPGIKLTDINNTQYGNLNGYFERLLPQNAPNNTTSYLDFATEKPYTFFSCWLGSNDVLQYALTGASSGTVTDKDQFQTDYTSLITRLTATGQKGVVATIPDVTAIPYFNTVTYNLIIQNLQKVNAAVTNIYIKASTGSGPINQTYNVRAATADDLFVLNFDATQIGKVVTLSNGVQVPYGLSPLAPIDNQYVLDKNEVFIIKNYILSYNTSITAAATAKGLAVFDANTYLNQIKQNGITVNGIKFTADYITGGLFSLDGVHPTPRGYALEANEFIKAINSTYGTALPQADVSQIN